MSRPVTSPMSMFQLMRIIALRLGPLDFVNATFMAIGIKTDGRQETRNSREN
jgi:hypothetical protein